MKNKFSNRNSDCEHIMKINLYNEDKTICSFLSTEEAGTKYIDCEERVCPLKKKFDYFFKIVCIIVFLFGISCGYFLL